VVVNSEVVALAPGVDVMITIFGDFWQKNLRFSQKPVLHMSKLFHNFIFILSQNANIFANVLAKIFKKS
jgi:hypothetical protein